MPSSAIASGVVDETLSPEEIGSSSPTLHAAKYRGKERIELDARRTDSLRGMEAIYQLFLVLRHNIDFSVYKDSTALCRIQGGQ